MNESSDDLLADTERRAALSAGKRTVVGVSFERWRRARRHSRRRIRRRWTDCANVRTATCGESSVDNGAGIRLG